MALPFRAVIEFQTIHRIVTYFTGFCQRALHLLTALPFASIRGGPTADKTTIRRLTRGRRRAVRLWHNGKDFRRRTRPRGDRRCAGTLVRRNIVRRPTVQGGARISLGVDP